MNGNKITGYIIKFGEQPDGDFIPKDCQIEIGEKITDFEVDENGVKVIKGFKMEEVSITHKLSFKNHEQEK